MKYPRYLAALRNLGRTNDEIAAKLGCSKSMLYYYLRGEVLPPVEKIKRNPELDEALTLDFRHEIQSDLAQIPA